MRIEQKGSEGVLILKLGFKSLREPKEYILRDSVQRLPGPRTGDWLGGSSAYNFNRCSPPVSVAQSVFGLASVSDGPFPKPLFSSWLRLSALQCFLLLLLPSYLSQYFLNFSLSKLKDIKKKQPIMMPCRSDCCSQTIDATGIKKIWNN